MSWSGVTSSFSYCSFPSRVITTIRSRDSEAAALAEALGSSTLRLGVVIKEAVSRKKMSSWKMQSMRGVRSSTTCCFFTRKPPCRKLIYFLASPVFSLDLAMRSTTSMESSSISTTRVETRPRR